VIKKTFILLLLITNNICCQENNNKKWALGLQGGYTYVITPFNRNNLQLVSNIRYNLKKNTTIGFQIGINYTYETKIPDLRIGFRFQKDFIRW
jgi:hypothetical protein